MAEALFLGTCAVSDQNKAYAMVFLVMTKEEERALKRALMPQYAEVERLDETNEPVGEDPEAVVDEGRSSLRIVPES